MLQGQDGSYSPCHQTWSSTSEEKDLNTMINDYTTAHLSFPIDFHQYLLQFLTEIFGETITPLTP